MATQYHFAVQAVGRETPALVAKVILEAASELKLRFDPLESLDDFTVGPNRFVRYRLGVDPGGILDAILKGGRGIIRMSGGYRAFLPDGRTGVVSQMTMQAVPRALQTYRGTSSKHWQRQFQGAPA